MNIRKEVCRRCYERLASYEIRGASHNCICDECYDRRIEIYSRGLGSHWNRISKIQKISTLSNKQSIDIYQCGICQHSAKMIHIRTGAMLCHKCNSIQTEKYKIKYGTHSKGKWWKSIKSPKIKRFKMKLNDIISKINIILSDTTTIDKDNEFFNLTTQIYTLLIFSDTSGSASKIVRKILNILNNDEYCIDSLSKVSSKLTKFLKNDRFLYGDLFIYKNRLRLYHIEDEENTKNEKKGENIKDEEKGEDTNES